MIVYFHCFSFQKVIVFKRAAGIEPASLAWKANVLPLNYARIMLISFIIVEIESS
jgi:hypothetical protein